VGDRLCSLRGMGASGSHIGTLGGRGVVGPRPADT
jgi:hypothetical protein